MANLMAEWLILAGAEINEVQQRVENHLHDMILKTFDPKKADAIFAEEGETPSWYLLFSSSQVLHFTSIIHNIVWVKTNN